MALKRITKNYHKIVLFLVGISLWSTRAQEPPNFLIILTDDQGWNALSTLADPEIPGSGSTYYHTPNLDALAKEGMRFSRAYSAGPTCAPTRHSLQFGRSPSSLQIWEADNIKGYDAKDEESLANILKQYYPDYATAHFGKWHIAHSPTDLGFEINDGANGNLKKSKDPDNDPKYTFSLSQKAIAFMEEQKTRKKPFLLQVSYYADHLFFEAKTETIRKYTYQYADNKTAYQNNPVWAAMNEDLDSGIGMILKALRNFGLNDNTYVIFTSDNGYEAKLDDGKSVEERGYYKAHPLKSHKYFINEGGIRVPFIIKGPGIPENTVSRMPISTIDIYPTVLSIMDLTKKLPDNIEGGNLMPHIVSGGIKPIERKNDFLVFRYSKPQLAQDLAIVQNDFKLLKADDGKLYLWNLSKDLGESKNLINDYPELTEQLHEKLSDYFKKLKKDY